MDQIFEKIEKILREDVPKKITVEQNEKLKKIQRRIENARNKS